MLKMRAKINVFIYEITDKNVDVFISGVTVSSNMNVHFSRRENTRGDSSTRERSLFPVGN